VVYLDPRLILLSASYFAPSRLVLLLIADVRGGTPQQSAATVGQECIFM
jgi:hypothetical protein